MKQHLDELHLAMGAAALVLVFAGAVGARADDQSAAMRPEQRAETLDQMQSRMQALQAMMTQLQRTTDPAERQKLLSSHMRLMQEQMTAMRAMGGGMMQMMHGPAGMGMGMGSGMPQAPGPQHQAMEDRVDMLQMMMEQMMGQMQMQSGPSRPAN